VDKHYRADSLMTLTLEASAPTISTRWASIKQGRSFTPSDNEQAIPVAIINETMARQYWPVENAIGKRFKLGDPTEKRFHG